MKNVVVAVVLVAIVFVVSLKKIVESEQRFVAQRGIIEQAPTNLKATFAYQALKWYNDQRSQPTGTIPVDWREKAMADIAAKKLTRSAKTTGVSWSEVGPNNIGGRVRSIAIDPTNTNVMYAGSVSGGVFKTTNGGTSWFPTSDAATNLAITSIVIDPTNTNTIYAATGEGYFNIDALRGAGVLKSTDGGASWTILNNFSTPNPSYSYYFINKLIIRSDNPSTLLAGMIGGIWRTTNGGTSWSKLTVGSTSSFCMDLVMDPTNNNNLYASFGLFSTDGIYKSTNGGTNWSKISTSFPSSGFGRISLAISQSSPSTLYASLMDSVYYTHSIRYTTNGGTSWSTATTPFDNEPMINGTHLGGQGWYNNVIAIHPTTPTTVFAGGINMFKSTNGTTFSRVSNGYGSPYMHVDQHAIVFHPTTPSTMYFGNDGGVFRTTDGGATFSSLNNGLAITQFYSGAVHPTSGSTTYYGGTQDNGTLKTTSPPTWSQVFGGDGGATAVDFTTPTTVYTEYVFLEIFKSANSGTSWSPVMSGIPTSGSGWTSDRCSFIAPFTMDPSNSQVLVAGTYRIYRTTNGGGLWTAISTNLTGDVDGANGVGSSGATITAIGIAKSAGATIYIGTSGNGASVPAKVQVTTNTGGAWNDRTAANLPNRQVKGFGIDATNAARAFVVYSGYNTNTPTTPGHVFLTTSTGTSWTNVSGDLPDVPVNAILLDPNNANHLLIGTDLGVFETANGGTNWTQSAGVPNVSVADLDYRASDGLAFAATHGRGMFRTTGTVGVNEEPRSDVPKEFALNQNYPNPFNPSTTISFTLAARSAVRLTVYDAAGREVQTLMNDELPAGSYRSTFDASSLASGVYVYKLQAGLFVEAKKMILVK